MRKLLSPLEQRFMELIWSSGEVSADDARRMLAHEHDLKDSTIRTIFRRLEQKGYVEHSTEGRSFRYRGVEPKQGVAAEAIRHILDRFCNGSVEQLLVGMVDHKVADAEEIQRIAKMLARLKAKSQQEA